MVGESDTARARISRRVLWNKEKFTFDDWWQAAFDTHAERTYHPEGSRITVAANVQ
jgi:hypothetical protein